MSSILHKHIIEWLMSSLGQLVHTHLGNPGLTLLAVLVPAINHTTIVISGEREGGREERREEEREGGREEEREGGRVVRVQGDIARKCSFHVCWY